MIYNFDELSFTALSVDRYKHSNGVFNVAPRPFSALSFRVCGSGEIQIGDSAFSSSEGDILFIPAGVDYTARYTDSESIAIHILDCNYSAYENIKTDNYSFILELFEEILKNWQEHHVSNRTKSELFSLLQKINDDHASKLEPSFIKAINFAQSNFTDPSFSVSDLCRIANMSISGIYRRFCSYFGMSPKQYVLKLRISYALELLAKDRYTVKKAALMSGFSDEKYFSRLIKQRLGKPPSYFL